MVGPAWWWFPPFPRRSLRLASASPILPPLSISLRPLGAPVNVRDLRRGSRRRRERSLGWRSLARGGRLCRCSPRSGPLRGGPSEGGRSVREGPVRCRISWTSPAYWPQVFRDTTGLSCGARWRSVSRHFSTRVYLPVRPVNNTTEQTTLKKKNSFNGVSCLCRCFCQTARILTETYFAFSVFCFPSLFYILVHQVQVN